MPTIALSPASPAYKLTVMALDCWERRVLDGQKRVKDLHDDLKAAVAADAALQANPPTRIPQGGHPAGPYVRDLRKAEAGLEALASLPT